MKLRFDGQSKFVHSKHNEGAPCACNVREGQVLSFAISRNFVGAFPGDVRGNYINRNLECSDLHANYSYLLLRTGLDLYRWAASVATEACRSLSEA